MIPALSSLPARPRVLVVHWTGGHGSASPHERRHYHYLVERDGTAVTGVPVRNNTRRVSSPSYSLDHPDGYAAHTARFNSYAIGIALCGMAGAKERPFSPGASPIVGAQTRALVALLADLCTAWGLSPTERHICTHEEVDRLHGVSQAGKWDVRWLPRPNGHPITGDLVGPWLRGQAADRMSLKEAA